MFYIIKRRDSSDPILECGQISASSVSVSLRASTLNNSAGCEYDDNCPPISRSGIPVERASGKIFSCRQSTLLCGPRNSLVSLPPEMAGDGDSCFHDGNIAACLGYLTVLIGEMCSYRSYG